MGRSRGGNTTKIHAIVDRNGLPIALKLTPGQAHDGKAFETIMGGIGEGTVLLADRAYDSDAIRDKLAEQGALATSARSVFEKIHPPSARRSTRCEIWLSGSSRNSSISGRLQPAFAAKTPITSHRSSSLHYGSGCALMSL